MRFFYALMGWGQRLASALGGTNISAVTYYSQNQTRIHGFYQAIDLSLRDHNHDESRLSESQLAGPVHSRSSDSDFPKANSTQGTQQLRAPSGLSPLTSCSFKSTGAILTVMSSFVHTPDPGALHASRMTTRSDTSFYLAQRIFRLVENLKVSANILHNISAHKA